MFEEESVLCQVVSEVQRFQLGLRALIGFLIAVSRHSLIVSQAARMRRRRVLPQAEPVLETDNNPAAA